MHNRFLKNITQRCYSARLVSFQETTQKFHYLPFQIGSLKSFLLHPGLRCTRLLRCDDGHYRVFLCCWERANPELNMFGVTVYERSAQMRLGSHKYNIHPKQRIFQPEPKATRLRLICCHSAGGVCFWTSAKLMSSWMLFCILFIYLLFLLLSIMFRSKTGMSFGNPNQRWMDIIIIRDG